MSKSTQNTVIIKGSEVIMPRAVKPRNASRPKPAPGHFKIKGT